MLNVGDIVEIHSYKHDGKIHRIWKKSIVLDVDEEKIILGNFKVPVIEEDGRTWRPRNEAILTFYKNKWFNIIAQLKEDGISYYCNIATPYVVSDHTIKYIDYDLDLRVAPDLTYRVVDREEYEMHRAKYEYSKDIDKVVHYELENLIAMVKEKIGPFNKEYVDHYHKLYQEKVKN